MYDILNARKLQNFNSDINSIHFLFLGHRSLIRNKTQTAVIKIINLLILYKLDVSYASQHTFSKVYNSDKGSGTEIKKHNLNSESASQLQGSVLKVTPKSLS